MEPFKYSLSCTLSALAFASLPAGAAAEPPAASSGQPPANVPAFPRFDILRFEVSGNTLLDPAAIEQLLSPHTGSERDFGDIQRALEALQEAYLSAGYGAVQVRLPEQDVEKGTVRFLVIEGRIGRIQVRGSAFHDEANIIASVPELKVGDAPRAAKIEANLKVANENPSKKTQVFLKSTDKPGEIDATLQVADEKTWKAGVLLDNTGTPETGDYRLGVFYQNSNVANKDQVLTMQFTTSPEKIGKVKIYGAGYRIPLYALGDSIEIFAGYSDVDSGTVQNLFTVSGSGNILGGRYNQNLRREGDYDHKLVYGIDHRAYRNSVQLNGAGASLVPDVTVHPLSLSYAGEWHPRNRLVSLYLAAIANLKGGSNGGAADFAAARANATADYAIVRYGAEYTQAYGGDWQTRVAFNGQYTRDALVPGELFGIGGASSVRGFYEREMANDTGYRGSLELYTPDFGERIGDDAKARALVFCDFADISRNKALPGNRRTAPSAASGRDYASASANASRCRRMRHRFSMRGAGISNTTRGCSSVRS